MAPYSLTTIHRSHEVTVAVADVACRKQTWPIRCITMRLAATDVRVQNPPYHLTLFPLPHYLPTMSAAQRVLEMDELLRSILSYIHTPVVWSEDDLSFDDPPPTRGFLLSAMHVNKQWRDVGLDYLWSDINAGDLARILLYWQYYSSQVRTPGLQGVLASSPT